MQSVGQKEEELNLNKKRKLWHLSNNKQKEKKTEKSDI